MRLGQLLVLAFVGFLASVVIAVLGFGVAFEFSNKILVPWLGVSAQYHNLATLIGACVFAELGAALIVVLCILAGIALFGLFRLARRAIR